MKRKSISKRTSSKRSCNRLYDRALRRKSMCCWSIKVCSEDQWLWISTTAIL